MRLVALFIPSASTIVPGTLSVITSKPSPSSRSLARAAWAAQSPGGLSLGTFTSSVRNATSRSNSRSIYRWMVSEVAMNVHQYVEQNVCSKAGVRFTHGFQRIVANAAITAADKQHAERSQPVKYHGVIPCAAWQDPDAQRRLFARV